MKHERPIIARPAFLVAIAIFLGLACALAPPRVDAKTESPTDKILTQMERQTKLLEQILSEEKAQTTSLDDAVDELEEIRKKL